MCLYLIRHVKRCQDKNLTCHRNPSPNDDDDDDDDNDNDDDNNNNNNNKGLTPPQKQIVHTHAQASL